MSVIRREIGSNAPNRPGARSQAGQRVTRFVFTLNNWTEEEYSLLTEDFALQTKWLVVAKETAPGTGTPHLQGACVLGSQMTWSRLKAVPCFARAHLEVMRGKPEDSAAYCSKEDEAPFVHGNMPTPGKRNDLRLATDRILKEGTTVRDLAKDPEAATVVVKFFKGLTVLRSLSLPDREGPPIVIWLHGATGTGKTRCAYESGAAMARALGRDRDDIWISSGGLRWFDGYDGQTVAIFDDFRAKHVTSFAFLLRLLDRYPVNVEFKGGSARWIPRVIFITCPSSPDDCFATRKEHVPEDIRQLERRISRVVHLEEVWDDAKRTEFLEECVALLPGGSEGQDVDVVEEDPDALDPDFLS